MSNGLWSGYGFPDSAFQPPGKALQGILCAIAERWLFARKYVVPYKYYEEEPSQARSVTEEWDFNSVYTRWNWPFSGHISAGEMPYVIDNEIGNLCGAFVNHIDLDTDSSTPATVWTFERLQECAVAGVPHLESYNRRLGFGLDLRWLMTRYRMVNLLRYPLFNIRYYPAFASMPCTWTELGPGQGSRCHIDSNHLPSTQLEGTYHVGYVNFDYFLEFYGFNRAWESSVAYFYFTKRTPDFTSYHSSLFDNLLFHLCIKVKAEQYVHYDNTGEYDFLPLDNLAGKTFFATAHKGGFFLDENPFMSECVAQADSFISRSGTFGVSLVLETALCYADCSSLFRFYDEINVKKS